MRTHVKDGPRPWTEADLREVAKEAGILPQRRKEAIEGLLGGGWLMVDGEGAFQFKAGGTLN
jgi:hypothetical protein